MERKRKLLRTSSRTIYGLARLAWDPFLHALLATSELRVKDFRLLCAVDKHLGNCQNYGPFLGPYYSTGPNTGPNLRNPKRDHNFDNPPFDYFMPT